MKRPVETPPSSRESVVRTFAQRVQLLLDSGGICRHPHKEYCESKANFLLDLCDVDTDDDVYHKYLQAKLRLDAKADQLLDLAEDLFLGFQFLSLPLYVWTLSYCQSGPCLDSVCILDLVLLSV